MERSLNTRFKKIAKSFGGGLVSALKGGGIAGIAIGLIDKLLNPLQEVQAAIDKALHGGDDLATFAKQFNTTAGNLARLQGFAKSTGLDPEGLRMLMVKFQDAVANQMKTPNEQTSVANFTGKKDTAEAFFEFIQALQKMTPIQQNLVQQEVFGERQILKASSFLGANFSSLNGIFNQAGVPSAQQQTSAAMWLGQLQENRQTLEAIRDQKDLITKSKLISDSTINKMSNSDQLDLNQGNKNLSKFDTLEALQMANQRLMNDALNIFLKLAPVLAAALGGVADKIDLIKQGTAGSRVLRGVTPGFAKEK